MSDGPKKHPLRPLSPEHQRRILDSLNLDANREPKSATLLEREANRRIRTGEKPMSAPVVAPPFVPESAKRVATAIASLAGVGLLVLPSLPLALPAWVGLALFAVAAISGFLAGLAMPGFGGGKPLVPLTAVPALLSAAAALAGFAESMPPGTAQNLLRLAAALLTAGAGKAIPAPVA